MGSRLDDELPVKAGECSYKSTREFKLIIPEYLPCKEQITIGNSNNDNYYADNTEDYFFDLLFP